MRTSRGIWAPIVLVLACLSLQASATAGDRAPEPVAADPADDRPDPPPTARPTAILADRDQMRTVATGSTAGFDADPALGGESTPPGAGATGWWAVSGPNKSEYTIDSCGSSYAVEMTAYDVEPRMGGVVVYDWTPDACAAPLTGRFYESVVDDGPDVIRIDDPSGAGGPYLVNYSRTPIDAFAAINTASVGELRRVKHHPRLGRAAVGFRIGARGESPLKVRCRLDDGRAKPCLGGIVYKGVRSGRHSLSLKVGNRYSGKATDKRHFRVPYRKR